MIPKPLRQCYAILIKNLVNHLANKKKICGEFIFPVIISALYVLMQSINFVKKNKNKAIP